MAAWGPIDVSSTKVAVVLAFVWLVPLVIAVVGSLVHAFVVARRDGEVKLLPLFLRWWIWSTVGWIGALYLNVLFS